MNPKSIFGAASVALLSAGALANPQSGKPTADKPMPRSEQAAMPAKAGHSCHKASDVVGAKVRNAQRADIGQVEDLIIDPSTGRIEFAVLSLTTRGDKDQWHAVPFQSLAPLSPMDAGKPAGEDRGGSDRAGSDRAAGSERQTAKGAPEFTLNLDPTKLTNAPGFPKAKWPDINAPSWRTDLDTHYGVTGKHEQVRNGDVIPQTRMCRVSEILDKGIETTDSVKLGDIEELAIDAANARVSYVVVSTGGFLGMGEKMHAIPWEAVKLSPRPAGGKTSDDKLVVNITKERLMNAPEYKKGDWAQMSDRAWASELYTYYGYRPYWSGAMDAGARDPKSGARPTDKSGERREKGEGDPH